MRESAIRNATPVEAVQGIEDIKLMRAEQRFQNQWNNTNDVAATVGMKQRWLTGLLLTTRPRRYSSDCLRGSVAGGVLSGPAAT